MAVPKKKTSPSKRGMRRAHHALNTTNVVFNKTTGEAQRQHHVSADGFYGERQVVKKQKISDAEQDQA